jgi:hypothetical protein
LISKANDEEKNVEKLGSESKLNRKIITFTARIDDIIKMKSIVNLRKFVNQTHALLFC